MSFKNKIISVNTTQELVDFVKSMDSTVSFLNGRKFSYEKSGEKVTYNQLIAQIHSKLQGSKELDGSRIAKALKELDEKAEKQLSNAHRVVRILTYVKRIFSFFPREQKLKEIGEAKVATSQEPKSIANAASLPQKQEIVEKVTFAHQEQIDVVELLFKAKIGRENLKFDPIAAMRAKIRSPGSPSRAPSAEEIAERKFNQIIQDKFTQALTLNGLSVDFFTCYSTVCNNFKNICIKIILLKPESAVHQQVKGEFSVICRTPTGRDIKTQKDFPNTMYYELNFPFLSDLSEELSAEKILKSINTTIDESVSSLKKLNLLLNDSLIPENEPNFFSPSKGVKFNSLNVWPITIENGMSDSLSLHAILNLTDELKKNIDLEISIMLDLSKPFDSKTLATAIRSQAISKFDEAVQSRYRDPFENLRSWALPKLNAYLNTQTIHEAINSLANIMEMPALKEHFKNNDRDAIQAVLCKKNIHKMCLKFHPDKNPSKDGSEFIEFNERLEQVQNWLKTS